jgi:hypothetical protein
VNAWINQAYFDACVDTESIVTSSTMAVTANVSSYTLPSAVARIKQMFVTPVSGSQSGPIQLTTLEQILAKRRSQGTAIQGGYITHYAMLGADDFEVYPTPGSADTITIYYVGLPTALSADSDLPVIQEPWASKLLEYGALAEAGDWKGDPTGPEWRQIFELWKQRYRAHLTRKMGGQAGQFTMFPSGAGRPHDPSTDLARY